MRIQNRFTSKKEAIEGAKALSKTEKYVNVIESKGLYYVENESNMVRIWEQLIWSTEK